MPSTIVTTSAQRRSDQNCEAIVIAKSAATAERLSKFSREEFTRVRIQRFSLIPHWHRSKLELFTPARPRSSVLFVFSMYS